MKARLARESEHQVVRLVYALSGAIVSLTKPTYGCCTMYLEVLAGIVGEKNVSPQYTQSNES